MTKRIDDVEQELRSLPTEERARLIEILMESLAEGPAAALDTAWQREIAERVAAYERGDLETFAAEEVFAEARRLVR